MSALFEDLVLGVDGGDCGLESKPLGEYNKLDAALDFESTGRNQTAAKSLHLMARGAHVSGFVLRPNDGLSDVAIVCNGATRFLSPSDMQWLMHESRGSIVADHADAEARFSGLVDAARSALAALDLWGIGGEFLREVGKLRDALEELK